MKPRIRILPVTRDLRTAEQRARGADLERQREDLALESEWRRRVRENSKEVSALPRRVREALR